MEKYTVVPPNSYYEEHSERYICKLCYHDFSNLQSLYNHCTRKHNRCFICGVLCLNFDYLQEHRYKMHPNRLCNKSNQLCCNENNTVHFHCQICNKIYKSEFDLYEHEKKHPGLNDNRRYIQTEFQCKLCGIIYKTKWALQRHMAFYFKCNTCKEYFKTLTELNTHDSEQHVSTSKIDDDVEKLCERKQYHECTNDITNEIQISQKSEQQTNQVVLQQTSEAHLLHNVQFKRSENLLTHQYSGTPNEMYFNATGTTIYYNNDENNLEQFQIEQQVYNCDWCDQSFHTAKDLTPHVNEHFGLYYYD